MLKEGSGTLGIIVITFSSAVEGVEVRTTNSVLGKGAGILTGLFIKLDLTMD
jgi:hypothetical protein